MVNISACNKSVPSDWKRSIITLVLKKKGDPDYIEDWRPISLLCASYKIYTKLIQQIMVSWIAESNRLSKCQKGSVPRNGLQELVFTLEADINFLHQSSKLYVNFGSIGHQVMLNDLSEVGYPVDIISITKDICTGSTFQVKIRHGLTRPITRARGIQGCPWSLVSAGIPAGHRQVAELD